MHAANVRGWAIASGFVTILFLYWNYYLCALLNDLNHGLRGPWR